MDELLGLEENNNSLTEKIITQNAIKECGIYGNTYLSLVIKLVVLRENMNDSSHSTFDLECK